MSRTLSKEKYISKSLSDTDQRTERKKARNFELPLYTKNTIWLNKIKIPFAIDEELPTVKNEKIFERERIQKIKERKFLKVSNPTNVKINRARIIDWLLDVCRAFELRWETYWCAVQILDFLIFTVESVKIGNIHITATTSLFMATKIHEFQPPSIKTIIEKAAYDAFSYEDVIRIQSQIILFCANHEDKPRYLQTIYNTLFELYPQIVLKDKIEILRKLVLIWMDPAMAFKLGKKRNSDIFISYTDIVMSVIQGIQENQSFSILDDVKEFYRIKYDCENLQPNWHGFTKIRL